MKEISDIINSGIQPLQNLSVILKFSSVPDERTEWARFWIAKGLDGEFFSNLIECCCLINFFFS